MNAEQRKRSDFSSNARIYICGKWLLLLISLLESHAKLSKLIHQMEYIVQNSLDNKTNKPTEDVYIFRTILIRLSTFVAFSLRFSTSYVSFCCCFRYFCKLCAIVVASYSRNLILK